MIKKKICNLFQVRFIPPLPPKTNQPKKREKKKKARVVTLRTWSHVDTQNPWSRPNNLCLWFFWPLQYLLSWQKISLSFYNEVHIHQSFSIQRSCILWLWRIDSLGVYFVWASHFAIHNHLRYCPHMWQNALYRYFRASADTWVCRLKVTWSRSIDHISRHNHLYFWH